MTWPTDRPGYPQNPERAGLHWLEWCGYSGDEPCGEPTAFRWERDGWWDGSIHRHARYWKCWRYVEPVRTPAEVAAAVQAERDECVRAVEDEELTDPEAPEDEAYNDAITDAAAAIRARGPTPALDAALAQARRETWEKAAGIVHAAYLTWACLSSVEARDRAGALADAEAAIRSAAAGEEGK